MIVFLLLFQTLKSIASGGTGEKHNFVFLLPDMEMELNHIFTLNLPQAGYTVISFFTVHL